MLMAILTKVSSKMEIRTDKGLLHLLMDQFIRDPLKITKGVALESLNGSMVIIMKENFLMANETVKEYLRRLMGMYMKGNSRILINVVMEFINLSMEILTREILKMITLMDKALLLMQTVTLTKENLRMIK